MSLLDAMHIIDGVSIIIPFRNAGRTLVRTLDSLVQQEWTGALEVLCVDDNSTDNSVEVATGHAIGRRWPLRIVRNIKTGLANGYNLGIETARCEYLIIMHADCYVPSPTAVRDLISYFSDPDVVGVMSLTELPADDWSKMSFWDKVANARFLGRPGYGFGGKFDGLRRSTMLKIGGFDAVHFFSAGEDCDIEIRLGAIGKMIRSKVRVVHAHLYPVGTKAWALLRKQIQLGQGFGALLRKHFPRFYFNDIWGLFIIHCVKLSLFVLLCIPATFWPALAILILLGVVYSYRVFFAWDWRLVVVPFFNVIQFLIFIMAILRGLLGGKQQYDYNVR